jgi:phosphoenolpyruvate synthase/pyruvate phosphate dikinase
MGPAIRLEGKALAAGILTASGGRTRHAAVVARQLGKACLVACPGLEIKLDNRKCTMGGTVLNEGDLYRWTRTHSVDAADNLQLNRRLQPDEQT